MVALRALRGNIYVGAVLALMLAALALAAVLTSAQASLARWAAGREQDAEAYCAALTGLERLKPLCAGVLDPRSAEPGAAVEVPGAAGPVGGQAAVDRVLVTCTRVSAYAVEAKAVSVGSSGGARVAVEVPVRAEWAADANGRLALVRAAFTGPALRTAVP